MTSSVLLDTRSVAADLVRNGVALQDFPVDDLVVPVVEGWLQFLKKPFEEKLRWKFLNPNNADDIGGELEGPDDGYICRNRERRHDGTQYDRKEFFHYKRCLPKLLDAVGVDTSAETEWLKDLKRLHDACIQMSLVVTGQLEQYFPGHNLLARAERGVELGLPTLRLLCYKQAEEEGEQIGKLHTDRDWLTHHLADSMPGLMYKTNGKVVEYKKIPNKVLLFPGKKAAKLLGRALPAVPHEVRACPESVGQRRWTVVFFGHNDVHLTPEERISL